MTLQSTDGIECYVHVLLWCYCDKLRHNFFPICDSTSDIWLFVLKKKIRSSDQRTESTCCAVYSNLSITHILNNCCWHFIAIVISVVSDILRNKGQAIQMDDIYWMNSFCLFNRTGQGKMRRDSDNLCHIYICICIIIFITVFLNNALYVLLCKCCYSFQLVFNHDR